jgi:hypothetical protein
MFNIYTQEKIDNEKKIEKLKKLKEAKNKNKKFVDDLNYIDRYNKRVNLFTYKVSL